MDDEPFTAVNMQLCWYYCAIHWNSRVILLFFSCSPLARAHQLRLYLHLQLTTMGRSLCLESELTEHTARSATYLTAKIDPTHHSFDVPFSVTFSGWKSTWENRMCLLCQYLHKPLLNPFRAYESFCCYCSVENPILKWIEVVDWNANSMHRSLLWRLCVRYFSRCCSFFFTINVDAVGWCAKRNASSKIVLPMEC